jgi:hypothetical protein
MEISVVIDNLPIIKEEGNNNINIKNIMLIDKTIESSELFFSFNNNETIPIQYNYYTDRDKLFEYLEKEFINIDRIAFIFDNSMMHNKYFLNNELFFTENDIFKFENNETDLDNYSDNLNFLIKIIKRLNIKRLDFLACNSLQYNNWNKYYNLLQKFTSVVVGASNDLTGNINYGANWVMENTNEDIQGIYFNKNIINYASTLFSSSISYYRYEYYENNLFSIKVKNITTITIFLANFSNLNFFNGSKTPANPTKNYVLYYRKTNDNIFNSVSNINAINVGINPNETYEFLFSFQTIYYIVFGAPVTPDTILISNSELSLYSGKTGKNFDPNLYNTLLPSAIYSSLNQTYQLSYTLNYSDKLTPTLTNFSIPSPQTYDSSFIIIDPSSNSDGSFNYISSSNALISISGNLATVNSGTGTCTITAQQQATANYNSESIQSNTITLAKAPTIITNFSIPPKDLSPPFTITDPSSNRPGSFIYDSLNTSVATIYGNIVTIQGPGTSTITATQAATENYTEGSQSTLLLVSNICFPAGTLITTDQGNVAIEKINPNTLLSARR